MIKPAIFCLTFLFISCTEHQSKPEESDSTLQQTKTAESINIVNHDTSASANGKCLCDYVDNEHSNCDTTYFSNKSKLYWLCTKDSAWLTFETNDRKKVLISTLPYFDSRLGPQFQKEYKKTLCFSHYWISGCCHTPDVFFIDKVTAKETKRIAAREYIYEDYDNDILIYFTDSTFNKIEVFNIRSNKINTGTLPEKRISSTKLSPGFPFVASLFDEPIINKRNIKLPYKYNIGNNETFIKDTITIYR